MATSHFILQHSALLLNFMQKLKNKVNDWCGEWNPAAGGECALPVFGVWHQARLSVYCWEKKLKKHYFYSTPYPKVPDSRQRSKTHHSQRLESTSQKQTNEGANKQHTKPNRENDTEKPQFQQSQRISVKEQKPVLSKPFLLHYGIWDDWEMSAITYSRQRKLIFFFSETFKI